MEEDKTSQVNSGVAVHEETPSDPEELKSSDHGFATNTDQLPKGYYRSVYFWGTWVASTMCLASGAAGFTYIGPILSQINASIGPDKNIIWVALVYNLGLGVGLLLVGRITDIFGRRWFFIAASILGLIGSIIAATASSVTVLIIGETMIGLASSAGLSYSLVLGEMIPMKQRFAYNASVYVFAISTTGLGAVIAQAFVLYTTPGWRWCYYLCIIYNTIAGITFFLFYFPPNFRQKWETESRLNLVRHFDYLGTLLFIAGLVLFLLGLSWGGTVYPWKSVKVIASIVVGFCCLVAFGLWETFADLKEPLLPVHLLKNTYYVATVMLLGLGATVYYAFAIYWPMMVTTVYSKGDLMSDGWVSTTLGCGIIGGTLAGGFLAEKIGKVQWQCGVVITLAGIFLAGESPHSHTDL
jgi:MFS family permease